MEQSKLNVPCAYEIGKPQLIQDTSIIDKYIHFSYSYNLAIKLLYNKKVRQIYPSVTVTSSIEDCTNFLYRHEVYYTSRLTS